MLDIDWSREDGWEKPRITPYGDLSMSPAASSLHYGLQCFEGMKAYKNDQGHVYLFRPDMNAKRLNRSSTRLALPSFDNDEFVKCLSELLKVDNDWIPQKRGFSLYIRPTVISTDVCLGVAPAANAKLFIITCPVGPYYSEGFKPVSLFADSSNVRAWLGGTGSYKVGGNYAPTIQPQLDAAAKGYSQILWLGPNNTVTEVGAMNMFFFMKGDDGSRELVTSPLDGTVLPGITRDSVIALCQRRGEKVTERVITMDEIAQKAKEGKVIEAFGTGTAAIVSPVNKINFEGTDYDIPVPAESDSLAMSLMNEVLSIQYGELEYPGWSHRVL